MPVYFLHGLHISWAKLRGTGGLGGEVRQFPLHVLSRQRVIGAVRVVGRGNKHVVVLREAEAPGVVAGRG